MELSTLNTRDLAPRTLLWHYTDFNGLKGILRGSIWASSLPYLNDTEEFHHGAAIALEVLQNNLAISLSGQDDGAYASAIHRQVQAFFTNMQQPPDVFIAALSERKDDLSQWRAYGGNRGPMFSVGFDPAALERKAKEQSFGLDEVLYVKQNIASEVRLALVPAIESIKESLGKAQDGPGRVVPWAAEIAGELISLIPRFKNPKFSDEKEWRLIRRHPVYPSGEWLPLNFRQSGSLVVPYIEMRLHTPASEEEVFDKGAGIESPIAAITIGPSPHPEQLYIAVGQMLQRIGLSLVKVESSTVPFRNW